MTHATGGGATRSHWGGAGWAGCKIKELDCSRKKLAAAQTAAFQMSAGWCFPPSSFPSVCLTIGHPAGGRSIHEDSQHAEHNEKLGQARGWKGGRHHDDELLDAPCARGAWPYSIDRLV